MPSMEAALRQARDLYNREGAELYRIEGPSSGGVPKEEIMRWVAENKA